MTIETIGQDDPLPIGIAAVSVSQVSSNVLAIEAGPVIIRPVAPSVSPIDQQSQSTPDTVQLGKTKLKISTSSLADPLSISDEAEARIAADAYLQDEIDALAGDIGRIADPSGDGSGLVDAAVARARADIDAAKGVLQDQIDSNAAAAKALFGEAAAAESQLRGAIVGPASSGELDAFVGSMRAHFDLTTMLRSAAVVAAGLVSTQTIVQEAKAASVTTQQVGLAKIGEVAAAFGEFRTAQVDDNAAKAGQIESLQALANDAAAAIDDIRAVLVNDEGSSASRIDQESVYRGAGEAHAEISAFLDAARGGKLADAAQRDKAAILAAVERVSTVAQDANHAAASIQETLVAEIAGNAAAVDDLRVAQATLNDAVAEHLSSLDALAADNASAIHNEEVARTTADKSLAGKIETISAALGTTDATGEVGAFLDAVRSGDLAGELAKSKAQSLAGISRVESAVAEAGKALASSSFALGAKIAQNYAAYQDSIAAQAGVNDAVAAHFTTLEATVSGDYDIVTGQITSLQTVVSELGKASATKTDYVGAALAGDGKSRDLADFVAAMRNGKSLDDALRKSAVNAAGVQTNQAAIADLKQALSTLSTTTFARFGDNFAMIQAQATALADATKALASKEDTTAASLGGLPNEIAAFIAAMRDGQTFDAAARGNAKAMAAVAQQTIAQTDAAKALANYSMTVAAQFGDSWAAIRVNATSLATIQGQLAASYSVDLDVNGYATGFKLTNGGPGTSTFQIRADKFTIALPGYSAQPVMSVQNINGTPTLAFNGNIIADGTILNGGIAPNAVSNSAGASSSGGSCSVNLPVRNGARIAVIASFGGYAGGTDASGTLAVTVGGTQVASQPIAGINFGTSGGGGETGGVSQQYLLIPSCLLYTFTASSTGTSTIAMTAKGAGGTQRGPTSLVAMELSK